MAESASVSTGSMLGMDAILRDQMGRDRGSDSEGEGSDDNSDRFSCISDLGDEEDTDSPRGFAAVGAAGAAESYAASKGQDSHGTTVQGRIDLSSLSTHQEPKSRASVDASPVILRRLNKPTSLLMSPIALFKPKVKS